jgi:hypothetical protein
LGEKCGARTKQPSISIGLDRLAIPGGRLGRFNLEHGLSRPRNKGADGDDSGQALPGPLSDWPGKKSRVAVQDQRDISQILEPEEIRQVGHVCLQAHVGRQ